jgi:hypothetical protein
MATNSYQHSEAIAKLKSIKETIQGNPTTYQMLSALDDLLYSALEPMIDGTRFFEGYLTQILGWQTTNPKRKVTGVGRQAFSSMATMFLLLEDTRPKVKLLRKTKVDRGVLFEALRRWLTLAREIEVLNTSSPSPEVFNRLYDLCELCNVREGASIYNVYQQVQYWHTQASKFKEQILEKYTRLCVNTAVRDYKEMNHAVDLNDIVQTYLLNADKAINKCDADRGVLTSHIQNWLLSAKNSVMADNLQPTRTNPAKNDAKKTIVKALTESVSLDEIDDLAAESVTDDDVDDTVNEVRRVAKQFDPQGVGRILLHIEHELSEDDLQALRAQALQPMLLQTRR